MHNGVKGVKGVKKVYRMPFGSHGFKNMSRWRMSRVVQPSARRALNQGAHSATQQAMGLCFSCLYGDDDDGNNNERSSLLQNHQLYSEENLQEEVKKQQQRQNELAGIVNELSDNLIDVSTFMSNPTGLENSTQNISFLVHTEGETGGTTDKPNTTFLTNDEKQKVLDAVRQLDEETKKRCQITNSQPLYLTF